MKNKSTGMLFLACCVLLLVSGCAPGPNTAVNTAGASGEIAGFWLGWWHGLISIITFVISLFEPSVHIYEVHNNGAWYNLGFVLGSGMMAGGGSSVSSSTRSSYVSRKSSRSADAQPGQD